MGGNIETARSLQPMVRQQLGGLTPGDFAPVTRQFRLLRRTPSASEFFDRLLSELTTKGGSVVDSVAYRNVYVTAEGHKDQPVAA